MSFESILQKILEGNDEAIGIALMGNDGISIVHQKGEKAALSTFGEDFGSVGAEFGRILGDLHKASDALGGGMVNEVMISLSRFTLLFRELADDVVLVLALGPNGNLGKSRYRMRRFERELREEL